VFSLARPQPDDVAGTHLAKTGGLGCRSSAASARSNSFNIAANIAASRPGRQASRASNSAGLIVGNMVGI
jgi:hypothetical protein